jgi:flagellin-like protein
MKRVTKKSNVSAVSPVIATILMVAITVVLAAVLYVLVSGFLTGTASTKNIGVGCTKTNATAYKCSITSADSGVDFTVVTVKVTTADGTAVATWAAPVTFTMNASAASGVASPLATARIVDSGDGTFGLNDNAYLTLVSGGSATGLSIELAGGGASGSAKVAP